VALEADFDTLGWVSLPYAEDVADWAAAALKAGLKSAGDPQQAHWWQCQGTWFVGVDALPNDAQGAINGVSLPEGLLASVRDLAGPIPPMHAAQVSIVKPGYPKPREGESETAFGYRLRRDAAHVDGLRLERATGERRCAEYHQFILGLPLNEASSDASPLVVWDGSHKIMGAALRDALRNHDVETWPNLDISERYKAARREVFANCPRREVFGKPGEAYVLHRHLLHGVAPWGEAAEAPKEGRAVAYFRPEFPGGIIDWLKT
jgi:hypothetical protein